MSAGEGACAPHLCFFLFFFPFFFLLFFGRIAAAGIFLEEKDGQQQRFFRARKIFFDFLPEEWLNLSHFVYNHPFRQ